MNVAFFTVLGMRFNPQRMFIQFMHGVGKINSVFTTPQAIFAGQGQQVI
jgi:hypothetical protein